jgi:predicted MPP superfamily phosphohydrolase
MNDAGDRLEPAAGGSGDERISRRDFVRTAGLAGLGAVAVGVMAVESPHQFEVNVHSRAVRGLTAGVRVALLTDFHLGPNLGATDLGRWVRASNAVRPDLVCIVGDIVDQAYRGDLSELTELLPELSAPLGVYAVAGNHDRTRFRRFDVFREALHAARVPLLMNESVALRDDLYLAGLDDFRVGRPDLDAALEGPAGGEDVATVFLSHNPDVIPELPTADGSAIDLLLAGHTHGGQVRLPGIGPLVTSSAYGARYASGWVPAPMPAFVSRGLGVTTLPFRFACPAEVVVLDLVPAGA